MKSTQIHPLYLHQTDHPGLILISKKPTGSDNYSSLKISLKIALNAKNKMKIITGEVILNTVSEQIGNNLNFINSASKLWLELQEHYAQIDVTEFTKTIEPAQTGFKRSSFRKGVYCGNCGKECHLQGECYKIFGYPIGHPLYGKVQPIKQFKATKAVNMVITHDQATQNKPSTSG
ncbi:cysteine-rich receptor-like protein kinase 8 [Tanacetum coccineum]